MINSIPYKTSFVTARSLDLTSKYSTEVRQHPDDDITILVNGKEYIRLGDDVPLNVIYGSDEAYGTFYKANKIYKTSRGIVRINEFEQNDATIFALPNIGVSKRMMMFQSSFINAYLTHYNYGDEVGDTLFLIYRYMTFDFYENVIMDNLKKHSGFLSIDKDEDSRFDVIRMKIPSQYKDDIIKITQGLYRETSLAFKHNILVFDNRKRDDIITQVLYDSDSLRKSLSAELGTAVPKKLNLRTPPSMINEKWMYSK